MLNDNFEITSFMMQTEYKEQKLLPMNDIRQRDDNEKEEENYCDLIAKLLNQIIKSGIKLPSLLNVKNISESSVYFMMLI